MGIPYSKQINAAFDEVTPLVAAGFRILRTSKNLSIVLAAIQVLTTVVLCLNLLVLVGLLVTVSPDLEAERKAIVTPAVKWLMRWLVDRNWLRIGVSTLLVGVAIGGAAGWYVTKEPGYTIERQAEADVTTEAEEGEEEAAEN